MDGYLFEFNGRIKLFFTSETWCELEDRKRIIFTASSHVCMHTYTDCRHLYLMLIRTKSINHTTLTCISLEMYVDIYEFGGRTDIESVAACKESVGVFC